ncbi:MAG: PepSY domain-containing protein [Bradyrhizobium sp.]|uniref:PepSY domain-containing protein n=1 Tax=Bradyrhizobium sp. TaxID=376 RepID=UPI001DD49B57|nr:PepSY domain-containing protein [Bradyrhizobium sp.]MBV9562063.1 PepSY domain-containing protein [Bradyrhizobium sp.]
MRGRGWLIGVRILVSLHSWWGVVFCLLFAMWFASGIVMHLVPFPARTITALGTGKVRSAEEARKLAEAYGRGHGIELSRIGVISIADDQWTVGGAYDPDRPLYRAEIGDEAGTELYVASSTGDVVLVTTRMERAANYAGSIPHWIYPAALRRHRQAWSTLVWWLSLFATLGAGLGVIVGLVRLGKCAPARRGLRGWHHVSGLILAPFMLSWIFSGFLSMDDGRLFAHEEALFRALHTLDLPALTSRPGLRSGLIVGLCLCGFAFSLTGVVLSWRRVRQI